MPRTRCLLATAPFTIGPDECEVPEPGEGEVLIEVKATFVSPGTELRCLAGLQPGAAAFPFIPGYAAAGVVVAGDLPAGTPVASPGTSHSSVPRMWGGHCGKVVVASKLCVPFDAGAMGFVDAASAMVFGIAMRGQLVTESRPTDRVLVVGLGVIGQFSARAFAFHSGGLGQVVAVDTDPRRVAAAALVPNLRAICAHQPLEACREAWGADRPDVVVDATGSVTALPLCVECLPDQQWDSDDRRGSKLVVQGSYPGDLPVPYQDTFLKEATIVFPRDRTTATCRAAIDVLADPAYRLPIASYRPGQAQDAYDSLRQGSSLAVAFDWS